MNLRFVFSLIVSLLSLLPAAAQDLTRNWIRERIFLDAEGKKCVTSVQYFDGIGRETLLLTDGLSPGGGVACSLSEQSFAGRSSAKWLPATGLTGFDFLTPERVKSLAVSSHEGDSVPFSLTRRDALGRVSSVRNAGGDLAGKAKYRFFVRDRLGSVRSVADEDGNVLQQNLYYAWGGAWGDVCTAPGFQSYKYCGKYLDRKHGLDLYDYGARLYDPAAAFWTSPDPLCEKYYNISPYAFCNNNPVTFIDPDGRDWYKDTDNTFRYDINIHSQKSLTNGQKYIGKSFSHKGASFRSDGSILYKNETMAYNRLWSQANNHYRTNIEKEGRETSAFILKDGEVLVMPEYKNDDSTSQIELYGYNVKGNVLTKHNEIFEIVGQIHTHQNRGLPSSPSYYLDSGYGDLRLSINMHGAPVFTIGHNGMIYGIRGKWNNIESEYNLYIMNLTPTQKSRRNLLLGKTKITEIIKHFKPLQ